MNQYTVEAYDDFDHPNEMCCAVLGTFDTTEVATTLSDEYKALEAVRDQMPAQ